MKEAEEHAVEQAGVEGVRWYELDNSVKYPKCTCKAAKAFMKLIEDDKAHQFFIRLDDDLYSTVRSQILAMDQLPSLDRMFNMV